MLADCGRCRGASCRPGTGSDTDFGHGQVTAALTHAQGVHNPVDNFAPVGDNVGRMTGLHNPGRPSPTRSIGCPPCRHASRPAPTGVDPHSPQRLLLLLALSFEEQSSSITLGMDVAAASWTTATSTDAARTTPTPTLPRTARTSPAPSRIATTPDCEDPSDWSYRGAPVATDSRPRVPMPTPHPDPAGRTGSTVHA